LHSGRTAGGRVAGEIYNIGTDVEFTNLQLAEYLLDFYGLTERKKARRGAATQSG
jgi:hypothetical protein